MIHNYLGKIFRDLIYICVCAMRAMWRRRQRLNVAGAGNVALMGRDSCASARNGAPRHTAAPHWLTPRLARRARSAPVTGTAAA